MKEENKTKNTKTEVKKEHTPKKDKKIEEIEKLKQEVAEEKNKRMRIQAEMMNIKKRSDDTLAMYRKYANEDILKSLLPIVDNFERALSMENEENQEFLKGFAMIYTNILNILEANEVKEIISLNETFDPEVHQAVLTEKSEDVESGIVIEVLQKGYKYKDKVLRPAMVKVSE